MAISHLMMGQQNYQWGEGAEEAMRAYLDQGFVVAGGTDSSNDPLKIHEYQAKAILAKRLDIDATAQYAVGEWRPLTAADLAALKTVCRRP